MKGQNLANEHHVVRYVPYSRLLKDATDKPIGVLFSAFQRKDTEEGLSVTWLEYFAGERPTQIIGVVRAIRASEITPGKQSGYAIGRVDAIKAQCTERKHKIRIIHWPVEDNKAHAELRQFPRDDVALLERLATDIWAELVLNVDVTPGSEPAPDLPAT